MCQFCRNHDEQPERELTEGEQRFVAFIEGLDKDSVRPLVESAYEAVTSGEALSYEQSAALLAYGVMLEMQAKELEKQLAGAAVTMMVADLALSVASRNRGFGPN
jgi:hypothetical protein